MCQERGAIDTPENFARFYMHLILERAVLVSDKTEVQRQWKISSAAKLLLMPEILLISCSYVAVVIYVYIYIYVYFHLLPVVSQFDWTAIKDLSSEILLPGQVVIYLDADTIVQARLDIADHHMASSSIHPGLLCHTSEP